MQKFIRKLKAQTSDRADRVIKSLISEDLCWLSNKAIDTLFSERCVVDENGRAIKKGQEVKQGEHLTLLLPLAKLELQESAIQDSTLHRPVYLGHDQSWAVFSKPRGKPSYPHYIWQNNTLVNDIFSYLSHHKSNSVDEFLAMASPPTADFGLVQRLDNNTSGLIICAFNRYSLESWQKIRDAHQLEKTYYAIVEGHSRLHFQNRLFFLAKKTSAKMQVLLDSESSGEEAVSLSVETCSQGNNCSLVRVTTCYGARHIVRVVLSHLGHPLVGDATYRSDRNVLFPEEKQHYLHASGLKTNAAVAPHSDYFLNLQIPLPDYFQKFANQNILEL